MSAKRAMQITAFVGFFVLLAIFMVKIEAFELFYEFTRSHEDWELDEFVAVVLSALITGVFWFGIDARQKGQEIVRIYEESLKNERKMSDARRVQALGTLAGGVAHSGNNLMQPILTLARISKGQIAEDHPVQGHLDRIIVAAQNSGELFHSILKFSRNETELSQRVDLGRLIIENQSLLAAAVPNNIKLDIEISPIPVVAEFANNNLLDILLALISNGADSYNGASGKVEVTTHYSSEWSQLTVRDYGCGIPEKELDRIFEPFFTSKGVGMGTGLGLAIVKSLVEDAEGRVFVKSVAGEGTKVTVNIPIAEDLIEQKEESL